VKHIRWAHFKETLCGAEHEPGDGYMAGVTCPECVQVWATDERIRGGSSRERRGLTALLVLAKIAAGEPVTLEDFDPADSTR
jgi:hypothetical protein